MAYSINPSNAPHVDYKSKFGWWSITIHGNGMLTYHLRPARSKHCSMCKACIGRLDHHCFWINRCVGVNNHRFFFIFLFTLVQFCAYGAYLCFQIYRGMIIEWGLDAAYVIDKKTGQHSPITFRKAFLVGLIILHRSLAHGRSFFSA